ncbi:MAG: hypothetical protein ISS70_09785 [Phycisphaerae bacterium]|nr:hypothetical protein [Phycisphaerae bacterium]
MRNPIPRGFSFTRVILTVLVIVFVIGLLIPMGNNPHHRRFAYEVKQRAQLKSIETALELFSSEFEKYPPSDANDEACADYCGAMKLFEAVMGRDLIGCHLESVFRSDGTDGKGKVLYPDAPAGVISEAVTISLIARKGPYFPLDYANAHLLVDMYGEGNTGPFEPNHFVMCDVFKHVKLRGTRKKIGMPIL